MWENKNVLITGINGFVGSHLAKRLVDEGAIVTGIIRDNPKVSPLLELIKKDYFDVNLVFGDIIDIGLIKRILTEYNIDYVFHLAAQAIVSVANKNPIETVKSNVLGTASVLEACRTFGVKGILHVSTDKVYGEGELAMEDDALQPTGIYESTKVAAENIVRGYINRYDLPTIIARAVNIYGEYDWNKRIIPNTIKDILTNKSPLIFKGDDTDLREYIYVDDVIDAYLKLMEKPNMFKGSIYNIGSGQRFNQKTLVWAIIDIIDDMGIMTENGKRPTYKDKDWSNEIKAQSVSSQKIFEDTGWKAKTRFYFGIRQTAGWWNEWLKSQK